MKAWEIILTSALALFAIVMFILEARKKARSKGKRDACAGCPFAGGCSAGHACRTGERNQRHGAA